MLCIGQRIQKQLGQQKLAQVIGTNSDVETIISQILNLIYWLHKPSVVDQNINFVFRINDICSQVHY